MSCNEFKRWLLKQGVIFSKNGKGSHRIVELNGRKSVFPDHQSKEIKEGTRLKIKKDLGL